MNENILTRAFYGKLSNSLSQTFKCLYWSKLPPRVIPKKQKGYAIRPLMKTKLNL